MLSSQMLWPASCKAWVGFMVLPFCAGRPGWCRSPLTGQLVPGCLDDMGGLEAELRLDLLDRRRGAEGFHADDGSVGAGVPAPAEVGALLDSDPGVDLRRQHLVAVSLVLLLEQLPAG